MKIINIGGKDYTFEFSIEASLYNACTERVTNLMVNIGSAQNNEDIKSVISTISDIPAVAMTLFYAGLLENHGDEFRSIMDVKPLLRAYMTEHKEDGSGNFYAIMNDMIECMGDDGFFELTGLNQMMQGEAPAKKLPKTPQDHKKKATKVIEK